MAKQAQTPLWSAMMHAVPSEGDPKDWTPNLVYASEISAVANWIEDWQINQYSVVLQDVAEVINLLRSEAAKAKSN